jgi:hypothetical protein
MADDPATKGAEEVRMPLVVEEATAALAVQSQHTIAPF